MLVFNFVSQRPSYSNAQRTMTLIFICKLTTLTAFTINITSLILLHYPTGPKGYEALDQYVTYSYFRTLLTNQNNDNNDNLHTRNFKMFSRLKKDCNITCNCNLSILIVPEERINYQQSTGVWLQRNNDLAICNCTDMILLNVPVTGQCNVWNKMITEKLASLELSLSSY